MSQSIHVVVDNLNCIEISEQTIDHACKSEVYPMDVLPSIDHLTVVLARMNATESQIHDVPEHYQHNLIGYIISTNILLIPLDQH